MRNFLSILPVLVTLFFSSCVFSFSPGIDGKGDVVTTTRSVEPFAAIKVSSGLDLYITQGAEISVTVKTYENLQDIIITKVEDGKLKIYCDERIRADIKRIDVTVPDLTELHCSAGSDTWVVDTLNVNSLDVSVSSGANATINVIAQKVIFGVSSGADARLTGKADVLNCDASSGANLNAYDFISKICTADASSGADIDVYVTESFTGSASSGADISYRGNPASKNISNSSGGSVYSK